jgi:hypothetical protein
MFGKRIRVTGKVSGIYQWLLSKEAKKFTGTYAALGEEVSTDYADCTDEDRRNFVRIRPRRWTG